MNGLRVAYTGCLNLQVYAKGPWRNFCRLIDVMYFEEMLHFFGQIATKPFLYGKYRWLCNVRREPCFIYFEVGTPWL